MTLFFTALFLLQSALSDSDAMLKAIGLWGSVAMIGQMRGPTDTYWQKQIGVRSIGCQQSFTPLAVGVNTWDDAFNKLISNPPDISGPFKGILNIAMTANDIVGVTGVQIYLDGNMLPVLAPPVPKTTLTVTFSLDTTLFTNGTHVICVTGTNATIYIGRSTPFIFKIDQMTGAVAGTLANPVIMTPQVSQAKVVPH